MGGGGVPYAPIIQALRGLHRTSAGAWPADLARLLADDQDATAVIPGLESRVSPTAQSRLYESVLALLTRLGAEQPVVLVAEDLHWADRSTLDLLGYVARCQTEGRVLLVLTYRNDELGRAHPLRNWLAEIRRLPSVQEIELPRLSRTETAALLSGLLAAPADADVIDAVYERSEGNPLFSETLLPFAGTPDAGLPPTLRDLLASRLNALPEHVRRVLQIAAAVGHQVQHKLLARIADLDDRALMDAIRTAVDSQILTPVGMSYEFRHALYREVAYDDLLPAERQLLHGSLAQLLTDEPSLSAADQWATTGEIAEHWYAAADLERALGSAVEAGLTAESVYAFGNALDQLTRALELWDRVPGADGIVPLDRVTVLAHAAQAANLVGEEGKAIELSREAINRVDVLADPYRAAQLSERLGGYQLYAGHYDQAYAAYDWALDLLPEKPPTAERARVRAGLAMLAMAWSRLDEAVESSREAITLARAVGARRDEGWALNALGVVTVYQGRVDEGVGYLQDALRIAREMDSPDELMAASINLGHILGVVGRYDESIAVCLAGVVDARRVGLERQDGSFLQANAAESMIKAGRWSEAGVLLAEAEALGSRGIRAFPVLHQRALLATARGEFSVAVDRLAQLRRLLPPHGGPDAYRRGLLEEEASLAVWQGRTADAVVAVEEGLALVEGSDEERFAGTLVALGLRAYADAADRGASGSAREAGRSLAARAALMRPDPFASSGSLPEPLAVAALARAERTRVSGSPDPLVWAEAAAAWAAAGHPYPEAYAAWREAEAVFASGGSSDAALVSLRRARSLARPLGAEPLLEEIRLLARWQRVDLDRAEPASPTPDVAAHLGLTPREVEVLALVAAGRTNAQIAEAMFISAKTASVHVSNILRKLGVARREEAARIGHHAGLAPQAGEG